MSRISFYNPIIQKKENGKDVTEKIKNILTDIINNKSIINNNLSTLTFKINNDNISMDVIKNNENYLFCRIGKEKESYTVQIRDNETKESSSVINTEDSFRKTVERCTFFLIDYNTGIVSFIKGADAPSPSSITYIFDNFEDKYVMILNNIISPKHVNLLIKKGKSISRIKLSIANSDPTVLKELGISDQQILALQDTDMREVEVTIKCEPKKKLIKDNKKIKNLIYAFKGSHLEDKVVFSGNEEGKNQADYDFLDSKLNYSVPLNAKKTLDGRFVNLTLDELEFKIIDLYKKHKQELLFLTNKIIDN